MSQCACKDVWRFEACDLRTGTVRAILHPTGSDLGGILNRVGSGTLTLATREVKVRDIWPHLTSVYVTRDEGDGPECIGGFMVDSFGASSSTEGGTTSVGVKTIEQYLYERMLRIRREYSQVNQNQIAADLVEYVRTQNGIPLFGQADASTRLRDRTYEAWDRNFIGPLVENLSNVIDGPDWEMQHTKTAGKWQSTMIFRDWVGEDRGVILQSDREGSTYGLDVDAANHATVVDAIGSGEEQDMLIATATDAQNIYPQFDAAPAWKEVSEQNTLQEHADGYLEANRDPVAVPSIVITGPSPTSRELRLGDTVEARINHGAVTYNGPARVTGISWKMGLDIPDSRDIELVPLTRSSQSVLNQIPTNECEEC